MAFQTQIYAPDPDLNTRVANAVREVCKSRKTVKASGKGRVRWNSSLTERLVEKMIEAAAHAALRSIPDSVRRVGVPADNSRIILAQDIMSACTELGLSAGRRYEAPNRSLVVELYAAVAPLIWPHGASDLNPRSTFDRLKVAKIVRN
jgi:hypothetical protein